MDKAKLTAGSKRLSWLLRFGAAKEGLSMDSAGWVDCEAILTAASLTRVQVEEIVSGNNKRRFQWEGDRIRACQGHGRDMPVTQEALEASWEVYRGQDSIWHGTNIAAVAGIVVEGIVPGDRTHVHLAETTQSPVGKRANVALLLEVGVARLREEGRQVFRSPNGVILVRDVPPGCIVGMVAISKKAKKQKEALCRSLGVG